MDAIPFGIYDGLEYCKFQSGTDELIRENDVKIIEICDEKYKINNINIWSLIGRFYIIEYNAWLNIVFVYTNLVEGVTLTEFDLRGRKGNSDRGSGLILK